MTLPLVLQSLLIENDKPAKACYYNKLLYYR